MGIRRVADLSLEEDVSLVEQAKSVGLPFLETLNLDDLDAQFIRQLSLGLVREQMALPLWIKHGHLEVAISSTDRFQLLDEYRIFLDIPSSPFWFRQNPYLNGSTRHLIALHNQLLM